MKNIKLSPRRLLGLHQDVTVVPKIADKNHPYEELGFLKKGFAKEWIQFKGKRNYY